MPYGTEPFTDGYGDFKQPTVIDYDKKVNNTYGKSPYQTSEEEKKEILDQFKKDQEEAYLAILHTNPFYAGGNYDYIITTKDGKLVWDAKKLDELKSNIDWLYTLLRFLNKRKSTLINT